jgi:hypothetical protein
MPRLGGQRDTAIHLYHSVRNLPEVIRTSSRFARAYNAPPTDLQRLPPQCGRRHLTRLDFEDSC